VALLHDVVEDTAMELEDLRAEGFSETVLEAISLLTHDKSVPYMDYIRAIRQNPLATKVKLADLAHNSDPARLPHQPTEQDLARLAKYAESRRILEGPEESQ
jgi:(p)ppGpp synthase/HD superfamily hydrolase